MQLADLVSLLDDQFLPEQFEDGCHNGLVVPGGQEVHRMLLGVSLTRDLVDRAVEQKAQALLVHHGIFQSGPWFMPSTIFPVVKQLMNSDISLFAYHLPMDAHPEFSHNRSLAEALGAEKLETLGAYGLITQLPRPLTLDEVIDRLPEQKWADDLGVRRISGMPGMEWNQGQWICRYGPDPVRYVALVSGKGGGELDLAVSAGAELLVTGEISGHHPELAALRGINLISLGHELSETGGLQRLGEWLRKATSLDVMISEPSNPL